MVKSTIVIHKCDLCGVESKFPFARDCEELKLSYERYYPESVNYYRKLHDLCDNCWDFVANILDEVENKLRIGRIL